MGRTLVYFLSCAAIAIASAAAVAAPGQDRPGQPTQARVFIENRANSGQAIPVSLERESLDAPIRVQVTGSPAVTIGGSIALPTRAVRQNWEYQTVTVPAGQDPAAVLAPLGRDAWEATAQLATGDGSTRLLLKRPL
jgi:hypothetical protein